MSYLCTARFPFICCARPRTALLFLSTLMAIVCVPNLHASKMLCASVSHQYLAESIESNSIHGHFTAHSDHAGRLFLIGDVDKRFRMSFQDSIDENDSIAILSWEPEQMRPTLENASKFFVSDNDIERGSSTNITTVAGHDFQNIVLAASGRIVFLGIPPGPNLYLLLLDPELDRARVSTISLPDDCRFFANDEHTSAFVGDSIFAFFGSRDDKDGSRTFGIHVLRDTSQDRANPDFEYSEFIPFPRRDWIATYGGHLAQLGPSSLMYIARGNARFQDPSHSPHMNLIHFSADGSTSIQDIDFKFNSYIGRGRFIATSASTNRNGRLFFSIPDADPLVGFPQEGAIYSLELKEDSEDGICQSVIYTATDRPEVVTFGFRLSSSAGHVLAAWHSNESMGIDVLPIDLDDCEVHEVRVDRSITTSNIRISFLKMRGDGALIIGHDSSDGWPMTHMHYLQNIDPAEE